MSLLGLEPHAGPSPSQPIPHQHRASQKAAQVWIIMWIHSGAIPQCCQSPWGPEQMRSQQAEPPGASGEEQSLGARLGPSLGLCPCRRSRSCWMRLRTSLCS